MRNLAKFFPLIAVILISIPSISHAQFMGPQIPNPYCPIPTLINENIGPRALATIIPNAGPVIFVKASATGNPILLSFMLAHECGHHANGHVLMNVSNPFAAAMFQPQEELQADCWAAQVLRQRGEIAPIVAALQDAQMMMQMFVQSSPPSQVRIPNIRQCAGI